MEALLHDPKVWISVAFVLFIIGFIKYAVPFITKALDTRAQDIQDELEQAVALREEAQNMLADYKQKQKEMLAEAESILKLAQEEAGNMVGNAEKELEEELARRTKMAQAKIERAESDAIRHVQENMVQVATEAAKALIVDHLEESGDDELVEMALDNVERIVH
ncbi:MAG: hypothetical protein MRY32_07715 [Rickettsiales bacterium]|nr:hypothetical protein [Rickettsiales bacterium]